MFLPSAAALALAAAAFLASDDAFALAAVAAACFLLASALLASAFALPSALIPNDPAFKAAPDGIPVATAAFIPLLIAA